MRTACSNSNSSEPNPGFAESHLSLPIEDYALIGTATRCTGVQRGSIDWLCVPHFDSAACFAALLEAR